MEIGALLWIAFLVRYSECTCSLPTNLAGSWTSSEQGSLTFTSTSLQSYPTTTYGTFTFTCDSYSDSQYVLKSPIFTYHSIQFEAYLCLVLTEVNSAQFIYFIGSEPNSIAGNDRIMTSIPASPLNVSTVCDRTSYPTGTHYVMVKDNDISTASVDCPSALRSSWTYTFDDGSGSDVCAGNTTSADGCTSSTAITFSYSSCTQMVLYSSSGSLNCLYSFTSNSTTYINMYNTDSTTDESSTYRFSCLVMTSSGNNRYLTQYPKQCHENQTSTSIVSPGAILVYSLSSSCPTTTSESVSAATIALAVVIPLIVIIVVIIVSYFCWVNYEKRKIEEAARPDPKFANGEIRNRRKNVHDGVISSDKNGNMIRREESILISMPPLSAREEVQSSISDLDDYGHDVDSDDDEYEVKDITEFSLTDDIPRIIVQSATPRPPDDDDGGKTDVVDASSAKHKKRRRRRKKSAKSRISTDGRVAVETDTKNKRKTHSHTKKNHLNTKDKITFGTSTLLLKMPAKRQKKKKKYMIKTEVKEDGMPEVDEKEKELTSKPSGVKEESLREKAYKMRLKKGETLADLIKKRKKVPILKHPMEASSRESPAVKPPTSSWGLRRGTTPKTAPSMTQVEQADINGRLETAELVLRSTGSGCRQDDSMVMFRRANTDLDSLPKSQEATHAKVPEKVTFYEPAKPANDDLWKKMRGMWNLASQAISHPSMGPSTAFEKKGKKTKVRKIQV